jgi:hypothetical protein
VGWWQIDRRAALDQVEAGDHGCPGLPEVEHPAVPEPSDGPAHSMYRIAVADADGHPVARRSRWLRGLVSSCLPGPGGDQLLPPPSDPTARAMTSKEVRRAAVACRAMNALARLVRGIVSVGLKALELVSDT